MLPMGSIVTVFMLIGVVFATSLPPFNVLQKSPQLIKRLIGGLVFAAGAWNVFWYAVQHITEFWGLAALVSGVLMMMAAVLIMAFSNTPTLLQRARPLVVVALLGCAILYGVTIYRL